MVTYFASKWVRWVWLGSLPPAMLLWEPGLIFRCQVLKRCSLWQGVIGKEKRFNANPSPKTLLPRISSSPIWLLLSHLLAVFFWISSSPTIAKRAQHEGPLKAGSSSQLPKALVVPIFCSHGPKLFAFDFPVQLRN